MFTTRQKAIGAAIGCAAMLGPAGTAHGAVSQRVHTQKATRIIAHAQAHGWRLHDRRMHSWTLTCRFADTHGPKGPRRTGRPIDCTFRAYRTRTHHGLIGKLAFAVRLVPHTRNRIAEDGGGTWAYSEARSFLFDPLPRSR